MSNFEIRIFANPAGYLPEGLNLNYTPELFTQDLVNKRNFDGERGTFKEGAYSILFAPNAYIIDYQFNVVNEANFRASEAHISIAIRRGYKLINAHSVFVSLRKEFNIYAAEEKTSVVQSIHKKLSDFNLIIADNVIEDFDQPRINAGTNDYLKRGLVAYDDEKQRDLLLENPNRSKFRGYGVIFVLSRIEANDIYNSIGKDGIYKAIPMSQEDYSIGLQYELVFPDGHIEYIPSKTTEVKHTCKIPYHKPLEFEGTPLGHWEDWAISSDKEGLRLTIGKQPVQETKDVEVRCIDSMGREVIPPSSLQFNYGVFNAKKRILKLSGEEISKVIFPLECKEKSKSFNSNGMQPNESVIEVTILTRLPYNFTPYLNFLRNLTGEDVELSIFDINNKTLISHVNKFNSVFYSEKEKAEMYVSIPETKKYFKKDIKYLDLQNIQSLMQKKGTVDVEFDITDEKILKVIEKKNITLKYKTIHHETWVPIVYPKDGHLLLRDQPEGKFEYKISIRGYIPNEAELKLNANTHAKESVSLEFSKTSIARFCDAVRARSLNIGIFILGCVVGILAAFYIPSFKKGLSTDGSNQDVINQAIADSLLLVRDSLKEVSQQVESLTQTIHEKDSIIGILSASAKSQKDAIKEAVKEASKSENAAQHPDIINKIIHLTGKEKIDIYQKGSLIYNLTYNKLSEKEKKAVDRLIKKEAYKTLRIPNDIQTVEAAIQYLDKNSSDE